jgi:hypothetical protein
MGSIDYATKIRALFGIIAITFADTLLHFLQKSFLDIPMHQHITLLFRFSSN